MTQKANNTICDECLEPEMTRITLNVCKQKINITPN